MRDELVCVLMRALISVICEIMLSIGMAATSILVVNERTLRVIA